MALIGLIKAVERFDPSVGVAFESFAVPTITGEIKRHFRDRTWRVSVPRRLKELRTRVSTAIEELEQRHERSPTPDEVAEYLGVDREIVLQTLHANQVYRSSCLESGRSRLGDAIEARSTVLHSPTEQADARLAVIDALRGLSERDRQLVYWRYFEERTQSEIGARLGVGQVQVSRLPRSLLAHLREHCAVEADDLRFLAVASSGEIGIAETTRATSRLPAAEAM